MAHALIVDDSPSTLESLEQLVQLEGFTTATAPTIDQARVELSKQPPDVVLVDLADTPTRYAKLDDFIRWTAPGGHLVFDDWHVASYRDDVNAWLIKHGQRIAEPILASTDEWGRYLAVWRAP